MNNVKNMSKEELYQYVLPTLLEINNKYLYLMLDSNKLRKIFLEFIYEKTKLYENNQEYLDYIEEIIDDEYQKIIVKKAKENSLKLIDNYVKCCYIEKDNFHEIVNFLRKFDDFLEIISLYDNDELVFEVVKNNQMINSLLKIVVDNIINDKKYYYLKNNPKLESLIEVYAILNKIDLAPIEEEEKAIENYNYKVEDFFRGDYLDMERLYSSEIRKKKLLTYKEEIELGKRIKQGDKEAINTLIEHNLRWVEELSSRYLDRGLSRDDLIQEGNLGLAVAASRFDPDKGYKFSTYATWWIKHYMQRAIDDTGRLIRIPVHTSVDMAKYFRLKDLLWRKLGHEPNIYEMMDEYGMTRDYINLMEQISLEPTSLDKPTNDDEGSYPLIEVLADKEVSYDKEVDLFEEILKGCNLTNKEKDILRRRFKFGERGEEVGKIYHVTRQRIDQIEKKAFAKMLKNPKKREELSIYAEELKINKIKDREVKNRGQGKVINIISDIKEKINNCYESNKQIRFFNVMKKLNFNQLDCLFIILRYGLKMDSKAIRKHNCMSKENYLKVLEKINNNKDNLELLFYLTNSEKIIEELWLQKEKNEYQNIFEENYQKGSFLEKIKIRVSYYLSFINESRFIYILKESNLEYNEIILLILKYVFDLDNIGMELRGFRIKNKNNLYKKGLFKINNSLYKDEIANYFNNKDLILEELRLEDLKEKQFVKRT